MLKEALYRGASFAGFDRPFRHARRGQLKVLLYHNIENHPVRFANAVPAEEFARHLEYLQRHYNLVRIDQSGEIQGMCPDRVNVLITFDDGFINNVEIAVPILAQYGVSAAFFVIADCVADGSPPGFQLARLKPGEDIAPWRTVDTGDIRAMRAAGMTIGSHSLAHTDSRLLPDAVLLDQARRSQETLEDLLGEPVGNFAFPWGYHNPGQPEALKSVFNRIFLTTHGFAQANDAILPRNEVANLAHLPHAASGSVDLLRQFATIR